MNFNSNEVNSYEVTLLEETQWKESRKDEDPTEEKIQICFQTLGKVDALVVHK